MFQGIATITNPNWPADIEQLTPHERRNVIDHYQYWKHDAILADQDTRRSPLVVCAENIAYDFNVATLIRNCNAFLPSRIWMTGRKRYDRRGTCGMHLYEHLTHADTTAEVVAKYPNHRIVAIDNLDGAQSIIEYEWQPDTVVIFGQESIGVSPAALELADDVVYIPQLGAVRSLNVGVASGIALYDYTCKGGVRRSQR